MAYVDNQLNYNQSVPLQNFTKASNTTNHRKIDAGYDEEANNNSSSFEKKKKKKKKKQYHQSSVHAQLQYMTHLMAK